MPGSSKQLSFLEQGQELTETLQRLRNGDPATAWMLAAAVAGGEVKLSATGAQGDLAGLTELVDHLEDGCEMFAYIRLADPGGAGKPRDVLLCWCGEGVPAARKPYFPGHIADAEAFFAGYHVRIVARDDSDADPAAILKRVHDHALGAAPSAPPPKPANLIAARSSVPPTYARKIAGDTHAQANAAPAPAAAPKPVFPAAAASLAAKPALASPTLPTSPASTASSSWLSKALSSAPTASVPAPGLRGVSAAPATAKPFVPAANLSAPAPKAYTPAGPSASSITAPANKVPSPAATPREPSPPPSQDEKTARQLEMEAMIRARQSREEEEATRDAQPAASAEAPGSSSAGSGGVAGLARKFAALAATASGEPAPPAQSPGIARRARAFQQPAAAPAPKPPTKISKFSVGAAANAAAAASLSGGPSAAIAAASSPSVAAASAVHIPSPAAAVAPPMIPPSPAATTHEIPTKEEEAVEPPAAAPVSAMVSMLTPDLTPETSHVHQPVVPAAAPEPEPEPEPVPELEPVPEHVAPADPVAATEPEPSAGGDAAQAPVDHTLPNMYVAQHAWTASDSTEIDLPQGGVAYCVDPLDGTWWVIERAGASAGALAARGMVPSNYLVPVAEIVAKGDAPDACAIAQFSHEPADEMELALAPGALVIEIQRPDPEWWQGRLFGTEKVGFFPAAYVQTIQP